MRTTWLGRMTAAALLLLACVAFADASKTHTGLEETEHLDIRYRPGSRAAAQIEQIARRAEDDFTDIAAKLAYTSEGRFELFLYDDVPELQAILKREGIGGTTSGRVVHLPYDNEQTRYHEFVHLVAGQLPKSGDDPRNLFLVEGLANALLEFVHGVPVHAVPAFYRKRKKLPALSTLLGGDFYAWQRKNPGFNAYDVAGSFMRFLIDRHGMEKTLKYYTGTAAKTALGADEKALEKTWLAYLGTFVLRPEVETLLAQRDGEEVSFDRFEIDPDKRLPAELLGKPSDWKSLARTKLNPGKDGTFKTTDAGIQAAVEGDVWAVCELGTKKYGDCILRARVVTEGVGGGVQLRLGAGCQAMLVRAGTFVWKDEGGVASNRTERLPDRGSADLLMVRRGDRLEIWVDGFRLVEGVVGSDKAPPGIAINNGRARFENLRLRVLK